VTPTVVVACADDGKQGAAVPALRLRHQLLIGSALRGDLQPGQVWQPVAARV